VFRLHTVPISTYLYLLGETYPVHRLSQLRRLHEDTLLMLLRRYLLDLVVAEEVKTWTQGIVSAQWN